MRFEASCPKSCGSTQCRERTTVRGLQLLAFRGPFYAILMRSGKCREREFTSIRVAGMEGDLGKGLDVFGKPFQV